MTNVLLVDDDRSLREVLALHLEEAGYRVLQAGDGRQAIALCERHSPAVVVLDMVMPEVEGSETVRVLRERSPGVRILAISGCGQDAGRTYLRVAARLGAHATLAKPFRPDELLNAVKRLLQG